ncbi:hypothetical protein RDI58_007218 [Solanum bulbocastanum]|uniref:DUF4218 domain-containing protein n=1 Tax=Solanum bulbocastanum TaxID=147425 RepID=A0AAN8YIE3_SOLBU
MAKIIVVISNKLEKILPPGFFDVMEHLPIHLVHKALLGGPVQYRWMYPFERPKRHDDIGNDPAVQSLSIFNQLGKGSKKRTLCKLTEKEKKSVELHVLLNCPEVQPFLEYNVNGFKFSTEKYSKNKKTNNSGVWVKGDDGNQNENVDYLASFMRF